MLVTSNVDCNVGWVQARSWPMSTMTCRNGLDAMGIWCIPKTAELKSPACIRQLLLPHSTVREAERGTCSVLHVSKQSACEHECHHVYMGLGIVGRWCVPKTAEHQPCAHTPACACQLPLPHWTASYPWGQAERGTLQSACGTGQHQ